MKLALGNFPAIKLMTGNSPAIKLARESALGPMMRGASPSLVSTPAWSTGVKQAGDLAARKRVSDQMRAATGAFRLGSIGKAGGSLSTLEHLKAAGLPAITGSATARNAGRFHLGMQDNLARSGAAFGLGRRVSLLADVMKFDSDRRSKAVQGLISQGLRVGSMKGLLAAGSHHHVVGLHGLMARTILRGGKWLQPSTTSNLRERTAWLKEFVERWEGHPLWFILSKFGLASSRSLAERSTHEVEAILLDALEAVVREGDLTEALRAMVLDDTSLSEVNRECLAHGLEHAQAGEWTHAFPPLQTAVEGALSDEAAALIVTPKDEKRTKSAIGLTQLLGVDENYTRFVKLRPYSDHGHAFRHGRGQGSPRDHTLFLILALVGWADAFSDTETLRITSGLMSDQVLVAEPAPGVDNVNP